MSNNIFFTFSPYLEVLIRFIYWKNIRLINKFNKKKKVKIFFKKKHVDFDIILRHFAERGVEKGALILVHSAFNELKPTGLAAADINQRLLNFVGVNGTIAMPAMPIFRNRVKRENYLTEDVRDQVYTYDVQKKRITTGALPTALAKHPEAVRSQHPINTMVAVGRSSSFLMEGNLDGQSPLPCGINSSWYKCVQENAWVVGLGVDLTHSLTMIHVAEDILDEKWPTKEWYREKKFIIKDGSFQKNVTLRERKPKWGTLHFAERTLCKDLLKEGILRSEVVEGVLVEMIRAKDLLNFLNSKNRTGYPYFGISSKYRKV